MVKVEAFVDLFNNDMEEKYDVSVIYYNEDEKVQEKQYNGRDAHFIIDTVLAMIQEQF